jgi:hypothetical protein
VIGVVASHRVRFNAGASGDAVPVAVNHSARQFHGRLVADIASILAATGRAGQLSSITRHGDAGPSGRGADG